MKTECIFCQIVTGLDNAFVVDENDKAIAILSKEMEVKGHTLVIPKKHFRDIFDIPANVLGEVMELVRKVSLKFQKKLRADGINILNASGATAQQSVFHFHVHVMPRFDGDRIDAWPDFPGCDMQHVEVLKQITKK